MTPRAQILSHALMIVCSMQGIPTEREVHSQKRRGSVYRALLVRR